MIFFYVLIAIYTYNLVTNTSNYKITIYFSKTSKMTKK